MLEFMKKKHNSSQVCFLALTKAVLLGWSFAPIVLAKSPFTAGFYTELNTVPLDAFKYNVAKGIWRQQHESK